jgi:hypothetical protein
MIHERISIIRLPLKILSSEMDPAEIRFIRKAFIEERGTKLLEKSGRPPFCGSPLKIPRHLVQLLEIRKRIAKAGMKFIAP